MKKILALFAISAMTLSSSVSAQLSFNFSDHELYLGCNPSDQENSTTFPGLTLVPNTGSKVDFGVIDESGKTVNGVAYSKRFKFNGGGYSGAIGIDTPEAMTTKCSNMPTQRYIKVNVTGAGTVKAVGTPGSKENRSIFVTDGANFIGSLAYTSEVAEELSVDYSDVSSLYLFCSASCNIYTLEISTASSISFVENNPANYKLLPEGIEVEGQTVKVKIFNSLSQLVKSSTENFVSTSDLSKGNYIVTIEADGGVSTVQIMK